MSSVENANKNIANSSTVEENKFGEFVIALSTDDGQYYYDRLVKEEFRTFIENIVIEMTPGYEPPLKEHQNCNLLHPILCPLLLDDDYTISSIWESFARYVDENCLREPKLSSEGGDIIDNNYINIKVFCNIGKMSLMKIHTICSLLQMK